MTESAGSGDLRDRTVTDFGEQWTRYTDNSGWYGSIDLFRDVFGPILDVSDIANRIVAEIGSGTGRIVQMLLEAGATHVTAIEPSEAFAVLEANVRPHGKRVSCLHLRGDQIQIEGEFDYIFAIGVLHHIPQPEPVMRAALRALKPGGIAAVWVYGREGNGLYLALLDALRLITTRLPHAALAALSWILTLALGLYVALCRFLPLPLRGYMRRVIFNLTWDKRYLVVYDQLNPAFAKYYTRAEAHDLLSRAGFEGITLHHRHGYSWAVVGRRPMGG